jgi:tyrosinase
MAIRTRKDVYSLLPTGPELSWFGRAIQSLQAQPLNQRKSWRYIAACHGLAGNVTAPTAAQLWRQCQHQTWFFLPWHRAYLAGFEAIIAAEIARLGGPANWALPYWNYSDTNNPNARRLPPAFRNQRLPNGNFNPLWAPRVAPATPGGVLTVPSSSTNLNALNLTSFTGPQGSVAPGFGGPRTQQPVHFGGQTGLASGTLESLPHNIIHTDLGGVQGAFMGDPNLAALDPIFWLHHCNIDRLWEVWRRRHGPAVTDTTDNRWRTGVTFRILTDAATPISFSSGQALNTQTLLHGYKYDSVPAVVPAVGPSAMTAKKSAKKTSKTALSTPGKGPTVGLPELIAASVSKIKLGAQRSNVEVKVPKSGIKRRMTAKVGAQAEKADLIPDRYFLSLDGVKAKGPARDYRVFIDNPDDDRLPLSVGTLSTFGIGPASNPKTEHGGTGLMSVFEITDAISELGLGRADIAALRVTFEPVERGKVEEIPDDYPFKDLALGSVSDITVDRINIYAE